MSPLTLAIDGLRPHLVAVALIGARLVPMAFVCPLLGGAGAPVHVKLGLVLALALFLHAGAGVDVAAAPVSLLHAAGWATKEALLGTTLGLIASLPFDAARLGGRLVDLFRGSSAEAALPLAGSKEAATGEVLHHLLVSSAAAGTIMPLVVEALARSFVWVPLGTFTHTEHVALGVARLVGGAFATGLAVGAPFAALSLGVDALLGLVSRAAQGMNLQDTAAPLKILGGAGVLWLAAGLLAGRLQELAHSAPEAVRDLLELGARGP